MLLCLRGLGEGTTQKEEETHRSVSQNGLGWEGPYRSSHSNPLPWAGTSSTSPGCSELHPTWPWALPGKAASARSVLSSSCSCAGSINFVLHEMFCGTELLLFEKLIDRELLDSLSWSKLGRRQSWPLACPGWPFLLRGLSAAAGADVSSREET